jgi:hypothetical protein
MAFAIASGVTPQAGIFTAVIGGMIISGLGGTKVCIAAQRERLLSSSTGFTPSMAQDLYERLRHWGKYLVLSGPHTQPLFMIDKACFLDRLGRENVCADIDMALARSREILNLRAAGPGDVPAKLQL